MALATLKARADFQRVAGGRSWSGRLIVLQAREQNGSEHPNAKAPPVRIGITVSNRTAKAATPAVPGRRGPVSVARNRMRRRIRAALSELVPRDGRPGFDYVVIGKASALTASYGALTAELHEAFARVHAIAPRGKQQSGPRPATRPNDRPPAASPGPATRQGTAKRHGTAKPD